MLPKPGLRPYNFLRYREAWTLLYVTISLVLFVYVAYRAYHLSFTHDESLSFTIIQGTGKWSKTANHHALNTWLMQFCSSIGGDGEFMLRLPNVAAFVLYLVAIYMLFWRERNLAFSLAFACLLLLNPFLLEYFSLARGYGLSLGFMMLSLFLLLQGATRQYSSEGFRKNFVLAMIAATAALLANFSAINFYVAALVFFIFRFIRLRVSISALGDWQWLFFIASLLPLKWAIQSLMALKKADELYFGAESLSETFASLIGSTCHQQADSSLGFWVFCFLACAVGLSLIFSVLKQEFDSKLFVSATLLFLVMLGLITEHYLFDAKYPSERTALFLVPLVSVFLFYLLTRILSALAKDRRLYVRCSIVIFLGFTLPLAYNLIANANIEYAYSWKYDANTKAAAMLIRDQISQQSNPRKQYTISNDWLFEPALNYYIERLSLPLKPANRDGVNEESDFVYTMSREFNAEKFQLIDSLLPSGARLFRAEPK